MKGDHFSGVVNSLISVIFPGYCPECQAEIPDGSGWICENCWQKLTPAGKGPWSAHIGLTGRIFVAFHYGDIARSLVHQMKFYGRTDVAEKLGQFAAMHLLLGNSEWKPEAIVPIPLHPVRIRERGYDQNLILAKGVADATGLPLRTDLVKRVRHTTAQSRLSDRE